MTVALSKAEPSPLSALDPSLRGKFESTLAKELGLNFLPSDPVWSTARHTLITGGVRAGKTTRGAFKAFKESLNPAVRLIWLVGPDYVQAQEEFRMIMEWSIRLGLIRDINKDISTPMNGQRTLKTRLGVTIQTKSAKHPETLASVAPDGIVMCEPGQMSGEVYGMCIGRLIEKGGWMFLCGTLEDDVAKPRWAWYEKLAVEWLKHGTDSDQRAYSLPTWTNTTIYPEGINDPRLVFAREQSSDYVWQRKYGGVPEGVENPVFPMLWEGTQDELMVFPDPDVEWMGGAIGVDYGTTFEHPSCIVVVGIDNYDRYWVRDVWLGLRVDASELVSIVEAKQNQYGIYQGCVDPNQRFMADMLGYEWARSGMGSTKFRFSLVNGLLERNMLFYDRANPVTQEAWNSMALCRYVTDGRGQLAYERPVGDDAAMAVCYAIEKLRGDRALPMVPIEAGSVHFSWGNGEMKAMEGRL